MRAHWQAYWKLALGILLVALAVMFVDQNTAVIQLKFALWEAELPRALVVIAALLAGVVLGLALSRWQRWRTARQSG